MSTNNEALVAEMTTMIRTFMAERGRGPAPVEIFQTFAGPYADDVVAAAAVIAYRRVAEDISSEAGEIGSLAGFLKAHGASTLEDYAVGRGITGEAALAEAREWAKEHANALTC